MLAESIHSLADIGNQVRLYPVIDVYLEVCHLIIFTTCITAVHQQAGMMHVVATYICKLPTAGH